jgi:hypothetical protein
MSDKQCFTWSQLAEEWIGAMYPWSDVCILIKGGGGGNAQIFDLPPHTYLPPTEIIKDRLTKNEFRRFVELVCKVNGISTKEIKERKERGEIEVTLSEIHRLYEDVSRSVKLRGIGREDI